MAEKTKRNNRIPLRLTTEEKELLYEVARREGMPAAVYVRMLVLQGIRESRAVTPT